MDWMTIEDFISTNNAAYKLSKNGLFTDAKPLVDKVVEFAAFMVSSPVNFADFSAKDYASVFSLGGYVYGELDFQEKSLECYQAYQFLKTQLKHGFPNIRSKKLYQFRSNKDYVLNNLRNNQITFADPRIQNDIVDCPIFVWLDLVLGRNAKYKKHIPLLKKSFDGYKITSFCQDTDSKKAIENTLMWSHYADSHRGFCIGYTFDCSDFRRDKKEQYFAARLFPVKYVEKNQWDIDMTDPNSILTSTKGYLTKSNDWSYENEVRMISYNPYSDEEFPVFTLGPKSKISEIYFGVKCEKETKDNVKEALSKNIDIKFYQMRINPKNIYSLEFDEIN